MQVQLSVRSQLNILEKEIETDELHLPPGVVGLENVDAVAQQDQEHVQDFNFQNVYSKLGKEKKISWWLLYFKCF